MEIGRNNIYNLDPNLEKPKFNDNPSKPKTTKEIQEDVKVQVAVKKAQEEEQEKVEEVKESNEIKQEMSELVVKLNREMSPLSHDIEFGYNEDLGQLMVNVIDSRTGDIIRQMPSEEAIKIKTKMKELVGMLFDKKG